MAVLVSQSSVEPVSVAEVKQWAKVEHDDEDGVLSALITSSRSELELWLKRAMVTQVWQAYYDYIDGAIYAPLIPISSVAIMTDETGDYDTEQTGFKFDRATGKVRTISRISGANIDGVQVTFTSTITSLNPVLRTALLELISYRFYNRGNIESSQIPATVQAMVAHMRVASL